LKPLAFLAPLAVGGSYFFWRRLQAAPAAVSSGLTFNEDNAMNASEYIDRLIARHTDWRGQTMGEVRRVIRDTVPDVTEELKWMGTPTWNHNGVLCICKPFKDMVKVTFLNGAQLDMDGLFNAELDGNQWRAIKYFEGDKVNAGDLRKLLLAAVAFNASKDQGKPKRTRTARRVKRPAPSRRARS
jgi:hypothetical protein